MKTLLESIFDDNLVSKKPFKYSPKTKDELSDAIKKELKLQGPDANLNIIDVSKVKDMSKLFPEVIRDLGSDIVGNIDISKWDVSKVTNMRDMFSCCDKFNSDLSKWNVSNVRYMSFMFSYCSKFNSDLSKWNVGKVKDMSYMFSYCDKFNSDLSKWNVGNVKDMSCMFSYCDKFNSDLSKWNVSNVREMWRMFYGCKTLEKNKKIPSWYK